MYTLYYCLIHPAKKTHKNNVDIYLQFRHHGSRVVFLMQSRGSERCCFSFGRYLIKHLEITPSYQIWTRKGQVHSFTWGISIVINITFIRRGGNTVGWCQECFIKLLLQAISRIYGIPASLLHDTSSVEASW